MRDELESYMAEMRQELENILGYWMQYTIDEKYGGFAGKIDNDNNINDESPKGSVLNSRILWSFSAGYNFTRNPQYLQIAERAYQYFSSYFIDSNYSGVYWTVDYNGNVLDSKKQIYALAFAVYGLSEYYIACKDEEVKQLAIGLYKTIIEHSLDKVYGGYIEALTRDWKEIADLRLSDKDANEKKSMNTHLHVLEGFTNLYRIWPDVTLKQHLVELVNVFINRIIDPASNHLILFFDEQWTSRNSIHSYGHDIEAAWLVAESAEIIGDEALIVKVRELSLSLADAASEGLDEDGGLWYEYDIDKTHFIKEKHWWPQAEAMVGYFNAWQISQDESYLQKSLNSWSFIKNYLLLADKGEWYWGVTENYSLMHDQDKVGMWKCPYHNSRACMEIIKRIKTTYIRDNKA